MKWWSRLYLPKSAMIYLHWKLDKWIEQKIMDREKIAKA